jgi:hypothetical protein
MKIFEPNKPFEVLHLDIVGSLPLTRNGNRYILTMMDRYSRMVKLVPLPIITASCIVMAIRNNWIYNYGVPDHTLTDRGSYFTGFVYKIFSKIFGFHTLFTTSYHPQTNGRLERFHHYLKERLRVLGIEFDLDYFDNDDWDLYIPNIQFSYNITPNRMTKHSPYDIIYADLIKLPIDRILNTDIDLLLNKEIHTFKNPTDSRLQPMTVNAEHRAFIDTMKKHRDNLYNSIKQNMNKYNEKRKQYYDKDRVKATHYKPNQSVYVDFTISQVGNRRKLDINRKHGIIMDKISYNVYVVKYDDGKVEPVNVDRLYTITTNGTTKNKKKDKNKRRQRNNKRRQTILNDENPAPPKRQKYNTEILSLPLPIHHSLS